MKGFLKCGIAMVLAMLMLSSSVVGAELGEGVLEGPPLVINPEFNPDNLYNKDTIETPNTDTNQENTNTNTVVDEIPESEKIYFADGTWTTNAKLEEYRKSEEPKGFTGIKVKNGKKYVYIGDKLVTNKFVTEWDSTHFTYSKRYDDPMLCYTGGIPDGQKPSAWGKCYYTNSDGSIKEQGVVTAAGKRYYIENSVLVRNRWITYKGKKYYAKKNTGELATGYNKIGNDYYLFNSKGELKTSGKAKYKIVSEYIVNKKGVIQRNKWITIKNKKYRTDGEGMVTKDLFFKVGKYYYYATKSGAILKNKKKYVTSSEGTFGNFKFDKKGRIVSKKKPKLQKIKAFTQKDCEYIENEIIRLVNEYRKSKGLNTLKKDTKLTKAADIRAKESHELFEHNRPFYRNDPYYEVSCQDIANDVKYGQYAYNNITSYDAGKSLSLVKEYVADIRENLAGTGMESNGYSSGSKKKLKQIAKLFFSMWKSSKGHRETMLGESLVELGVGVSPKVQYQNGEKSYSLAAAQLFSGYNY